MKIIIDAMGGDKAPLEIIKGAAMAKKEHADVSICLVGNSSIIKQISKENDIDISDIEIVHASDEIKMCDPPLSIRNRPDSSLRVALDMLQRGDGDALVSAGSTGAVHTGATLYVKRPDGISRASIGALFPFVNTVVLMDSGANIQVTPDHLVQFAIMGSIYMKEMFGIESPRVGLLNNGAEEIKGTKLQVEAYKKLSNTDGINFIGNVEGNEVPMGKCDVLVTDGFTGNIFLKLSEGMGKLVFAKLKGIFKSSFKTKLAYLLIKKDLKGFKKDFDASEHGGAPILGLKKTVIKAHGSSDAKAIKNAVRQAIMFADCNIGGKIDEECKKYSCLYNGEDK